MSENPASEGVSGPQSLGGWLADALAFLVTAGALAWAADLFRKVGLLLYKEQFLAGMLALALPLLYLKCRISSKADPNRIPWYDYLAALAGLFAERSGVFDIALEGKMLGGAFAAGAVAAATDSAWLGLGAAIMASVGIESVRAIVTDGAYCNDTILEYYMKRFARIFAKIRIVAENHPPAFWRFLRWLLLRECRRRFKCSFPSVRKAAIRIGKKPIFLVHGEKDSYIPVRQSQILYDILAGPKNLWIVPDARHNHSIMVRTKEYGDRVVRFFDEHLGVGKAPTPMPATGADASLWTDAPLESLASVDASRTADEPSAV